VEAVPKAVPKNDFKTAKKYVMGESIAKNMFFKDTANQERKIKRSVI
jgi:hypothetical protein